MISLINNDKQVASSEKHAKFRTREQKTDPIMIKMAEIDTLFMAKEAEKSYALGAHTYLNRPYRRVTCTSPHPLGLDT